MNVGKKKKNGVSKEYVYTEKIHSTLDFFKIVIISYFS